MFRVFGSMRWPGLEIAALPAFFCPLFAFTLQPAGPKQLCFQRLFGNRYTKPNQPSPVGDNPSKIQEFTLMRPIHGNL